MTSSAQPPGASTPTLSDTGRDAADSVTWPVRVAAAWSWRFIVVAAAAYLIFRMLSAVSLVAFSLILALFLTAILLPLQRRLRRWLPGPASLPAALALLIGIAVLSAIGFFVTWQITTHATDLGNRITDFVDRARNWLHTGPLHISQTRLDNLVTNITDAVQRNQGRIVSGAVQTVRTLAQVVGAALLVLLSTFFMLRDGEQMWRWMLGLVPGAAQRRVDRAARAGWGTFGGYMRGVVLIALFHGVTVTIVLLVVGVPLAVPLGALIFLGSFVPLLGLTLTGAVVVAVATLEHGVTAGIVVAVAIVALFQIEGHVLQPVIMSRAVSVHPLAVAVSVFAGTALLGIPGALIAVPFVAFVNTAVRTLRAPPGEHSAPEQD